MTACLIQDGRGILSFEFRDGRLIVAISRGDGLAGEDITANALKFRGISARCVTEGRPLSGFMRGEVILSTEDWSAQVDQTLSLTRAIAAWNCAPQNGHQSEPLEVFAFRAFDDRPTTVRHGDRTDQRHAEHRVWMRPSFTGTAEAVWDWYLKTQQERPELPYWIDGIVVKLDNIAEHALGEADQWPKGQVASSFEAESAETLSPHLSPWPSGRWCQRPSPPLNRRHDRHRRHFELGEHRAQRRHRGQPGSLRPGHHPAALLRS